MAAYYNEIDPFAAQWLRNLISAGHIAPVFGEQVEAAIRHGWLDLVHADMEGIGYAFAPVGIPAAGVGAPHIRQRLWFTASRLADTNNKRCNRVNSLLFGQEPRRVAEDSTKAARCGQVGEPNGLADADEQQRNRGGYARAPGRGELANDRAPSYPGPTNGHWRNADWLGCRDEQWRPVEPGAFPLVNGASARVGRLRAYGNAIVPQVAAEVIATFMECQP